jgi:hypothetical protein
MRDIKIRNKKKEGEKGNKNGKPKKRVFKIETDTIIYKKVNSRVSSTKLILIL